MAAGNVRRYQWEHRHACRSAGRVARAAIAGEAASEKRETHSDSQGLGLATVPHST